MPILGPPEALSPTDWRALVNYDEWDDLYTPDDGVVLHHGGGTDYEAARTADVADEIQQLQQWEGFHLYGRGWRGLAYGWGVGQSGTIYRIRGWNRYGAHLGDVDGDGIANNDELIPIIWIASGRHHTMSPAADQAIQRLRRWIVLSAPAAVRFYGHREVQDKPTSCPGVGGMAYVTENRTLPIRMFDMQWGWPNSPFGLGSTNPTLPADIRGTQILLGREPTGSRGPSLANAIVAALPDGTVDANGDPYTADNLIDGTQWVDSIILAHLTRPTESVDVDAKIAAHAANPDAHHE